MATNTTSRFRTSPKHFLTWSASAANNRIQKMSKNIVNNVSKLQTKMEKALPFHHHLSSSQLQQQQENSIMADADDGFYPTPTRQNGTMSSSTRRTINNNDSCDVDWFSLDISGNGGDGGGGRSMNSLNESPGNHFDNGKRTRFSFKNPTSSNTSTLEKNVNTTTPPPNLQFVNISTQNILNNNNGILINNNLLRDSRHSGSSSTSSDKSSEIELSSCRTNDRKSSLVKSLDLEMRPVQSSFYGGSINESKNLAGSSSESCRSANNSSSSISTAATVPIISPQWSRASSISIGSTKCDNQSRSPTSNNSNNNNNNKDKNSDEIRPSSLFTSPLSSPLKKSLCSASTPSTPATISVAMTLSLPSSTTSSTLTTFKAKDELLNSSSSPMATSTLPSKLTVTTFEEEEALKNASWFQLGIPREIALEVLRNEPIGSFIVRESTTKTGCFALSLRVPRDFQPTGIVHYLILRTGRGYKIKGFTKEFGSLTSLITHHSVMKELLPCPLSLPLCHRYRPNHRLNRLASDFVEPEKLITYNQNRKFTDF